MLSVWVALSRDQQGRSHLTFGDNVTVSLFNQTYFYNITTINGTLRINSGGDVLSAPVYGANSLLPIQQAATIIGIRNGRPPAERATRPMCRSATTRP
ncbi:MAG: hypothetical protein IPM98_12115 [Lewinellaceae bacterium]|nr:hypothetical protein [Lewinellaceae bacterium]